jgi:hypothetical protein
MRHTARVPRAADLAPVPVAPARPGRPPLGGPVHLDRGGGDRERDEDDGADTREGLAVHHALAQLLPWNICALPGW